MRASLPRLPPEGLGLGIGDMSPSSIEDIVKASALVDLGIWCGFERSVSADAIDTLEGTRSRLRRLVGSCSEPLFGFWGFFDLFHGSLRLRPPADEDETTEGASTAPSDTTRRRDATPPRPYATDMLVDDTLGLGVCFGCSFTFRCFDPDPPRPTNLILGSFRSCGEIDPLGARLSWAVLVLLMLDIEGTEAMDRGMDPLPPLPTIRALI